MGRIVHFEIHCDDLDRAERFYAEVFGWRIDHWPGAPADYRLITTGSSGEPGIDGALTERSGALGGDAVTAFVDTITTTDLAETARRVVVAGGEQVQEPSTVPGVGTVAYFEDTEGNRFGVLEPVVGAQSGTGA